MPPKIVDREHQRIAYKINDLINRRREQRREEMAQLIEWWDSHLQEIATIENEGERNQGVKEAHATFLAVYEEIGWDLDALVAEILRFFPSTRVTKYKNRYSIKVDGVTVYRIYFGDGRFAPSDVKEEGLEQQVYVKKGTNKQYVKDSRGTFISRLGRRAITENEQTALSEGKIEAFLPRDPDSSLGKEAFYKYDVGDLDEQSKLTDPQLEFLQNRDGTRRQKLLSITHTKHKIVGNHGYSFDTQPAEPGRGYGGSIFLDLAKIKQGAILNQHLKESQGKRDSQFPGWGERGTTKLKAVVRPEVEKEIPIDNKNVKGSQRKIDEEVNRRVNNIQSGPESKKLRKFNPTAPEYELNEANKSSVRNRETHLKSIPLKSTVTYLDPKEKNVEERYNVLLQEHRFWSALGSRNQEPWFWRELDRRIAQIGENESGLRQLLEKLGQRVRQQLRQSYQEDIDLVLGYPGRVAETVQRLVLQLIREIDG